MVNGTDTHHRSLGFIKLLIEHFGELSCQQSQSAVNFKTRSRWCRTMMISITIGGKHRLVIPMYILKIGMCIELISLVRCLVNRYQMLVLISNIGTET